MRAERPAGGAAPAHGAADGARRARTPRSGYRSAAEIAADLDRDPLRGHRPRCWSRRACSTPDEVLARYDEVGWQVRRVAEEVIGEPKLAIGDRGGRAAGARRPVRGCPGGHRGRRRRARAAARAPALRRSAAGCRRKAGPLTLAQTINATLDRRPGRQPGGDSCSARTSAARAASTASPRACERSSAPARVLRHACSTRRRSSAWRSGAGLGGLLPVPEIQYLAYLHNAEDQLRGEAATLQFFSHGAYRNPMVVRVAGLAYQKGFGGHFHNDNSVAVLRDIPGLVVAVPSPPGGRRRRCCGPAWPRPRSTAACASSSSRSRSTTTRDLHVPGRQRLARPRTRRRRSGAASTSRSAGPGCTATAST